jgi:hypothetical protein
VALAMGFVIAACSGDDGGGGGEVSTPIRTLAYVVSSCQRDPIGVDFLAQELRIQVGDKPPVTVRGVEARIDGTLFAGICSELGSSRFGQGMQAILPFKRLAVTPDGARVVFEVAEPLPEHVALLLAPTVSVDAGIYVVDADGSGLRRLGEPSREPPFRITTQFVISLLTFPGFSASPDSRGVTFTDLAAGPGGEDAIQIVSLDLDSGTRRPLTSLPRGPQDPCPVIGESGCNPGTAAPFFLDNQQIVFFSNANPAGMNPGGELTAFVVDASSGALRAGPRPVSLPDGVLVPSFAITGPAPSAVVLSLDLPPVGPGSAEDLAALPFVLETFLLDGDRLLQLTNFRRNDTSGAVLTADSSRVLFNASANPLTRGGDGEFIRGNPTENCQIFSIDRNGGDLRQLTDFREVDQSTVGCYFDRNRVGCSASFMDLDPVNGTLVFYSSCDPFGGNPFGGQIFAMRSDGSGLRQVTDARGLVVGANGSELLELVGPHAYSAPVRGSRAR